MAYGRCCFAQQHGVPDAEAGETHQFWHVWCLLPRPALEQYWRDEVKLFPHPKKLIWWHYAAPSFYVIGGAADGCLQIENK